MLLSEKQQETIWNVWGSRKWDTLCIDLIREYQFTSKGGEKNSNRTKVRWEGIQNENKVRKICLFTSSHYDWLSHRLDRNTYYTVSTTGLVTNQVELAWLTHYLLPSKVAVDRGNELLAECREIMINDYEIKVRPITSRNP